MRNIQRVVKLLDEMIMEELKRRGGIDRAWGMETLTPICQSLDIVDLR